MKKFMKDNRGLSFVEIIVVFAITALVGTVAGLSLAIIPSSEAKKAVTNVDAMMTRTRTGTLTKSGDVYMVLTLKDGSLTVSYYEDYEVPGSGVVSSVCKVKEVLSSNNHVSVSYTTDAELASATWNTLGASKSIAFSFSRSTTGFEKLSMAAGVATKSGVDLADLVATDGYCRYLRFDGGGVSYVIEMSPLTGSHYSSLY